MDTERELHDLAIAIARLEERVKLLVWVLGLFFVAFLADFLTRLFDTINTIGPVS